MDDDELIERIFDDEVPLAAEGLFINGVDPPGDDGGPVIVTLATDDPAHAEQVKLPGVTMVTRRVELNVPLGERELRDAGQAWRPKPGAGPPVRGRCPCQHR